jgi:hypothetical protein
MFASKYTTRDYPRTDQEIFDAVSCHLLLAQREKSIASGRCSYRSVHNRACAIGCLIPDDVYDRQMDSGVWSIDQLLAGSRALYDMYGQHRSLLIDLQKVHDFCDVRDWPDSLVRVADDLDLCVPDWLRP